MLRAHSLGLGTVIVGAFDAKRVGEVLHIPPGMAVVALTPLGYPDEAPKARPRKTLQEITHLDRF